MKTWGRGGLAALLLTSVELVVFLEVSIVNVALPALGAALAFTGTGLAWVVSAHQATFGGFQLVRLVFAVGLPAVFVGSTASAIRAAPADRQGAASGLLNTTQRVGAALGLTGALPAAATWTGTGTDVAGGLRVGFAIAAGLAVLGIVCALVMFTRRSADPVAATTQPQGAGRR